MRKQYHFWPASTGSAKFDAWDVDRLVELTHGLPVESISVEAIPEIDSVYWFDEGVQSPTVRSIVEHFRLVQDTDLAYPIILGPGNRVMDGMHRIARCLLEARPTIDAVRLDPLPVPDYLDCRPEDLSYD